MKVRIDQSAGFCWGVIRTINIAETKLKEKDKDGNLVNRTEAIASMGSASLDNEECYLFSKLMRSIGLVFLEHHARI